MLLKPGKVQIQIASPMDLEQVVCRSCQPLSVWRAGISSAMHIAFANFLSTYMVHGSGNNYGSEYHYRDWFTSVGIAVVSSPGVLRISIPGGSLALYKPVLYRLLHLSNLLLCMSTGHKQVCKQRSLCYICLAILPGRLGRHLQLWH